jgi:hypothetical protein
MRMLHTYAFVSPQLAFLHQILVRSRPRWIRFMRVLRVCICSISVPSDKTRHGDGLTDKDGKRIEGKN